MDRMRTWRNNEIASKFEWYKGYSPHRTHVRGLERGDNLAPREYLLFRVGRPVLLQDSVNGIFLVFSEKSG